MESFDYTDLESVSTYGDLSSITSVSTFYTERSISDEKEITKRLDLIDECSSSDVSESSENDRENYELDNEYRECHINKIVSDNTHNNMQNFDTHYLLKPINYLFYKSCVLFGNLFMGIMNWDVLYRSSNEYDNFNCLDNPLNDFEEENYFNIDLIA